jgi:hypothetical protein
LPIEERTYLVKKEAGGIWIHREPSSTIDPGFQEIICLDAKPVVLPASLGLPMLAGPQDSLRHSVSLQRTTSPNKMSGWWVEYEAVDSAAAEVDSNTNANAAAGQRRSRLMLRI